MYVDLGLKLTHIKTTPQWLAAAALLRELR
jgi:hypothetical protein